MGKLSGREIDRRLQRDHPFFRVEVAFLAEGGASKGGTVTGSREEGHGRIAASLPFLNQQYSREQETEAPPFLGRKLLHRGPAERSANEALEAGSRKGQEQKQRRDLRSSALPLKARVSSDMCVRLVTQSCQTLCDPMDCIPPGSSAHGDSPAKNRGVD